jgi:hypothetical protein
MRICRSAFLLTATIASVALADDPAGESDKTAEEQQISEALELTTGIAKEFSLSIAGENEVPLKFQPKSLLQWSNPTEGTIYGNVFIWTHEQRPQAIVSIYKWYAPFTHGSIEFHSLSTESIIARRKDSVVWQPAKGGVEWKPLPADVPPSDNKERRLIQLRQIARRFSIEKTDREQVKRNLRLMTQPIYRYASPSGDVVDGALFVFAQGTDPEVVLLLEAIPDENSESRVWRYALVRMNHVKFVATYQQEEVWHTNILPFSEVHNPRNAYMAMRMKRLK